jgi:hypothetical protein
MSVSREKMPMKRSVERMVRRLYAWRVPIAPPHS